MTIPLKPLPAEHFDANPDVPFDVRFDATGEPQCIYTGSLSRFGLSRPRGERESTILIGSLAIIAAFLLATALLLNQQPTALRTVPTQLMYLGFGVTAFGIAVGGLYHKLSRLFSVTYRVCGYVFMASFAFYVVGHLIFIRH